MPNKNSEIGGKTLINYFPRWRVGMEYTPSTIRFPTVDRRAHLLYLRCSRNVKEITLHKPCSRLRCILISPRLIFRQSQDHSTTQTKLNSTLIPVIKYLQSHFRPRPTLRPRHGQDRDADDD